MKVLAIFAMLIPLAGCYEYVTRGRQAVPVQTGSGSITIASQSSCILPAGTAQFSAQVSNLSSSAVDWFVDGVKGGSSSAGTISAEGLYLAPATTGAHTIQATSKVDTTVTASMTVNVTVSPGFDVSPGAAMVPPAGMQEFHAQTCGVATSSVSWTVDNVAGGNITVGTITADGVYTAPAATGTHTVQGTDTQSNKSDSSIVTVGSGIIVDFGNRTGQQHALPAGILGINHVDWLQNSTDEQLVARAGFKLSRTYANLQDVFTSQGHPDWKKLDPQLSEVRAAGFHVLLQVAYTPNWLQPHPNSCKADKTKAAPTDVQAWAKLAAAIVAHLDSRFPGLVTDYEIWNEPDTGGLCTNGDALQTYLKLYAAAAPLMKSQAAQDGVSIRVGGPTTAELNEEWLQALLTDASTAPYVDFVSYHNYVGGANELNATWDSYSSGNPLYALTQDKTNGPAAIYLQAEKLVAAGKQPLGPATPVYVDEFNTNWEFKKECCRNDPTYAPVWNALYVSDMLDTIYYGAQRAPGQLTYYSANTNPYFCVVGNWNNNMDCDLSPNQAPEPYPQYFAYQLMASADYLDMNSGGAMAISVSPLARGDGIAVSAFYTQKQDSILIVNPTGQATTESVTVQNPGYSSATATLFEVENGKSINRSSLELTQSGAAMTLSVSVPAYSVLGIAIQP
jgi:Glycosyl hydrolases family 39